MMFEGKHIHFSPVDNKPLCSYSTKICKQRRLNGYAFCIRHILEDKSAPFKQCSHVARYNKQYCTNPIPASEEREYCNSHLQALGMVPKKEKKPKKDKKAAVVSPISENKVKFEDRLRALIQTGYENSPASEEKSNSNSIPDDPYAFNDTPTVPSPTLNGPKSISNNAGNKYFADVGETNSVDANYPRSDPNSPSSGKKPVASPQDNKACIRNQQGKRSSKTMNMLQEKIAQNRLLDKLKKTQESSQMVSSPGFFSNVETDVHRIQNSVATEFGSKAKASAVGVLPVSNDIVNTMAFNASPGSTTARNNQQMSQPYYSVFHPHMMFEGMGSRLPPPPYSQALQYQASKQQTVTAHLQVPPTTMPTAACKATDRTTAATPRDRNECNNKVKVRTKKCADRNSIKYSTSHLVPVSSHSAQVSTAISQIKMIYNHRKHQKKDLYPLGLEFSDSDRSDSDGEDNCSCQNQWFQVFDNTSAASATSAEEHLARRRVRPARLALLKSEMRRQLRQLSKSQALSIEHSRSSVTSHRNLLLKLAQSCKLSAKKTVDLLIERKTVASSYYEQLTSSKPKRCRKSPMLLKKLCCYSNETDVCTRLALPFSRHCSRHIMYNVDQLLFEHCTAKFADNTQCCIPVFDICHELPLCPEHARKRDNYNKIASEPKSKKSKRKQKPAALTRTPKRNKKKKKPPPNRGSKTIPSQPVLTDSESIAATSETASEGGGVHGAMNVSMDGDSQSVCNDMCGSSDMQTEDLPNDLGTQLDSELDSDLVDGALSPEVIDNSLELPLDTAELANQASRLLEEHDFTEVLNKIPDDAFNDLFAESRNGEFMPSKEETEELERALAAVSKDVNSVKESLEKLSSVQIEEALGLSEAGLLSGTDHLTGALDVHTLSSLAASSAHNSSLEMLNGQFSHNDLTSISQALSTMGGDSANYSVPSQQQMPLPNGLASNSLLASDLQHLQTQYLHQAPVTSSVSNFNDNHNMISSTQLPAAYAVNGIDGSAATRDSATSQQWMMPPQQPHVFPQQNGFVFSGSQQPTTNNLLDSISSSANGKFDPQMLSAPALKQAMTAGTDSFHSVNNSTLETVSQQSTPAS